MNNDVNKTTSKLEEVMSYEKDQLEEQVGGNTIPDEIAESINILNQIINSACGKDDDGNPKAAITVAIDEWSHSTNKTHSLLTYSSYKPVVSIQKHYDFIQVDLFFASKVDNDMKVIWNHSEKFGQLINEITHETKNIPFFTLTIVPVETQGRYYISVTNPVFWSLQPVKPGAEAQIIRLVFKAENLNVFETDEIDMYEIEANVQRSLLERDRVAEAYEKADEESAQASLERNQKLEELRRNNQL